MVIILPCSTTVVQDAVNIEVVGSNPTGAVWFDCIRSFLKVKRKDGRVV